MLTSCLPWDLRQQTHSASDLSERLTCLSHEEALLVSRKTSFPPDWNQGTHLCLLDGPSLFMRLYVPAPQYSPTLQIQRQDHAFWLEQFKWLRQQALQGQDTRVEQKRLTQSIEEHLAWEEAHLFPKLDQFLGTTRVSRELGYEHLGIRRWLPQLDSVLQGLHPDSSWDDIERRRNWEKFSLDLIHLIEHHIEHEERGAYPLYERLP